MSEAAMMALAPSIGRARAHEVVYEAAGRVRATGEPLREAMRHELGDGAAALPDRALEAASYLGEVDGVVDAAVAAWRRRTPAG